MKFGTKGFIKTFCYQDLCISGFIIKLKVYGPSLRSAVYRRPSLTPFSTFTIFWILYRTFLGSCWSFLWHFEIMIGFQNFYVRKFLSRNSEGIFIWCSKKNHHPRILVGFLGFSTVFRYKIVSIFQNGPNSIWGAWEIGYWKALICLWNLNLLNCDIIILEDGLLDISGYI